MVVRLFGCDFTDTSSDQAKMKNYLVSRSNIIDYQKIKSLLLILPLIYAEFELNVQMIFYD